MKKIITVADDYGFTEGINNACLKATKDGILQNVGIMLNSPGTKHAINQIKNNEIELERVGIHITFNDLSAGISYKRLSDYESMLDSFSNDKWENMFDSEIKLFEDTFQSNPAF